MDWAIGSNSDAIGWGQRSIASGSAANACVCLSVCLCVCQDRGKEAGKVGEAEASQEGKVIGISRIGFSRPI